MKALGAILLALTSVCGVTGETNGESDFQAFQACVEGGGKDASKIVVRGNSRSYTDLNFHWQLKPPNIHPLAYFQAKDEDDVVAAVVCGRKYGVRVVPRSGGHSFEKYSFGDNRSVVLDLSKLDSVVLDNSTSTATIGSGALIGPIIMTLWNGAKSFFPVSSCLTVGISGLATGGGFGFQARQYGLTVDYIVGMRIVTANGQLLVVNNTTNSDLYWALRGGGGASFGIITSFIMKVVPAPPAIFTVTPTWPLDRFLEVYEAWQNFTVDGPRSVTAKMNINAGTISISFIDSDGTTKNFEEIQKLFPPANSTTQNLFTFPDFILAYGLVNNVVNPQGLLRIQRDSTTPSYQIEKSFYVQKMAGKGDLELVRDLILTLPQSMTVSFQAYGGAINDVPSYETAFVHRTGRFALGIIGMYIADGNTTSVLAGTPLLDEYFELGAKIFDGNETYQNYVDGQLRNYLTRYYGSNLPRLVEVKRKYDPDNYFYNPQSIPPILRKSKNYSRSKVKFS